MNNGRSDLDPQRVYAINQFAGVLHNLSKEGLLALLRDSYAVSVGALTDSTRQQLTRIILGKEYGERDVEIYLQKYAA